MTYLECALNHAKAASAAHAMDDYATAAREFVWAKEAYLHAARRGDLDAYNHAGRMERLAASCIRMRDEAGQ